MRREKASSDAGKTTSRGKSKKQDKGSNTDTQLKFPWYNEPIQESTKKILIKPLRPKITRNPVRLDNADKRMQKITKLRDKICDQQKQNDLHFTDKAIELPQKSELPNDSIPNGEDDTTKELPESFIGIGEVRGFRFT